MPALVHREPRLTPAWPASSIVRTFASADGAVKYLVEVEQGDAVETVLMPAFRPDRAAGCVSSQVGCAMGCGFCASAVGGLRRSLTAHEIVAQVVLLRERAAELGRRLSNVVFMGMGEPLHNLESVMEAVTTISPAMLGRRSVVVSTVGLVPQMRTLAASGLRVPLALSLHASDDETRRRLVPAARAWTVEEVMAAARDYQATTGRVVNIEYCLLSGVNDSPGQAAALADLMGGFRAHVNLIPHNPIGAGVGGIAYERPSEMAVERFMGVLRRRGVVAHVRRTRGLEIAAACGQLRRL